LILVEAAVDTLSGALAAERSGANRIELCANLNDGGTTPNAELIATVLERVRVPVFVMIRPRGGDFLYSADELGAMTCDIELAARLGISGIVTGALTAHDTVDTARTRRLVNAAAGLPVTFHRAFDLTVDLPNSLEQVIDAGVSRVLTSGGAATAVEGVDAIAALVAQARGRITIMAGGSIRQHNAREVIARTGVGEVHARLIDEASMRSLIDVIETSRSPGS
jgi:copper homeostasis protein